MFQKNPSNARDMKGWSETQKQCARERNRANAVINCRGGKTSHLSIKLDFTNVLLPDSYLTEKIWRHWKRI